jgi:hypothetical protein
VSWLEGGPVDLDSLAAAVEAVEPADGDERLEAEITRRPPKSGLERATG